MRSAPQTYDKVLAARLWDASAVAAGVPREVMCGKAGKVTHGGHTAGLATGLGEPSGAEGHDEGVVLASGREVPSGSTAATVRSRKMVPGTL